MPYVDITCRTHALPCWTCTDLLNTPRNAVCKRTANSLCHVETRTNLLGMLLRERARTAVVRMLCKCAYLVPGSGLLKPYRIIVCALSAGEPWRFGRLGATLQLQGKSKATLVKG